MLLKKKNLMQISVYLVGLSALFLISYVLYNRMLSADVYSDYLGHLEVSLSEEKTLFNHFVFYVLHLMGGKTSIAIFSAMITCMTAVSTKVLFDELDEQFECESHWSLKQLASIGCCICTPIYIPRVYEYFYSNQLAYNPWHNDTYSTMRMFAIWALVYYLRIKNSTMNAKRRDIKEYIMFAGMLFLATWSKPSFFYLFMPAMGIEILIDLINKYKNKETFGRVLALAMSTVPALIVFLIIYYMSFIGETKVDSSVAIGVSPMFVGLEQPILATAIILILPLIGMLVSRKLIKEHKDIFRFFWLIFLSGLLTFMFVYETGYRCFHGNFGWGCIMGNFILLVFSVYLLSRKVSLKEGNILTIIGVIMFIYQVACGVVYLYKIFEIGNYAF